MTVPTVLALATLGDATPQKVIIPSVSRCPRQVHSLSLSLTYLPLYTRHKIQIHKSTCAVTFWQECFFNKLIIALFTLGQMWWSNSPSEWKNLWHFGQLFRTSGTDIWWRSYKTIFLFRLAYRHNLIDSSTYKFVNPHVFYEWSITNKWRSITSCKHNTRGQYLSWFQAWNN